MRQRLLRIISLIIAIVFTINTVAFSAPDYLSRIRVSSEYANIRERWYPKDSSNTKKEHAPQIIIVEDAHENFLAQKNIASILSHLVPSISSNNIVVGVEGAVGDINVDYLRKYPINEARAVASETLMHEGYLTGTEFAAISSDVPVPLWGIEDKTLFIKNFKSFYSAKKDIHQIESFISSINNCLDTVVTHCVSSNVLELRKRFELYTSGKIQPQEYIEYLLPLVNEVQISLTEYTQLSLFLELIRSSNKINDNKLFEEIAAISSDLNVNTDATAENIFMISNDYYELSELWNAWLSDTSNHQRNEYALIPSKIELFRKYALLDITELSDNIQQLSYVLMGRLEHSQDGKKVLELHRKIDEIDRFVLLKARRSDVDVCAHINVYDEITAVLDTLSNFSARYDVKPMPQAEIDINKVVENAEDFYRVAEAREKAMLDNIITKMKEQNKSCGVIVAGGYHANGLSALLRGQKIPYLVITPNISDATDITGYMNRMMGSLMPLSDQLTSYITISHLNALMSEICEDESYRAVIESLFGRYWKSANIQNIDWAARLKMLQNNPEVSPEIQYVAKELFSVAQQVVDDVYADTSIDVLLDLVEQRARESEIMERAEELLFSQETAGTLKRNNNVLPNILIYKQFENKSGEDIRVRIQTMPKNRVDEAVALHNRIWGDSFHIDDLSKEKMVANNTGGHLIATDEDDNIIAVLWCASLFAQSLNIMPKNIKEIINNQRSEKDNRWIHYGVSVDPAYGIGPQLATALIDATKSLSEGMGRYTHTPLTDYGMYKDTLSPMAFMLRLKPSESESSLDIALSEAYFDYPSIKGVTFRDYLMNANTTVDQVSFGDYQRFIAECGGIPIQTYIALTGRSLFSRGINLHVKNGAAIAAVADGGRDIDAAAGRSAVIMQYRTAISEAERNLPRETRMRFNKERADTLIKDKNVLFLSFRLDNRDLDGVSLEVDEWAQVVNEMGGNVFYFSGQTHIPDFVKDGYTCPDAHFKVDDPTATINIATVMEDIYRVGKGHKCEIGDLDYAKLMDVKNKIKKELRAYVESNGINYIVAENILSYPGNFALSLALIEVANEMGLQVIAHSHDFWWEREQFSFMAGDRLNSIYQQLITGIEKLHILVINSLQKEDLNLTMGVKEDDVDVVPNARRFEDPPTIDKETINAFRHTFKIEGNDIILLAPVRQIERKNLELTLELAAKLQSQMPDKRIRVLITHPAKDSGDDYAMRMREYAKKLGVIYEDISDHVGTGLEFSLEDAYAACDLVMYTTKLEGWGNALAEAFYFKKPILVYPYQVYLADIKDKGGICIEATDDKDAVIDQMRAVLLSSELRNAIVRHNYDVGKKYFSHSAVAGHILDALSALNKDEASTSSIDSMKNAEGADEDHLVEDKHGIDHVQFTVEALIIGNICALFLLVVLSAFVPFLSILPYFANFILLQLTIYLGLITANYIQSAQVIIGSFMENEKAFNPAHVILGATTFAVSFYVLANVILPYSALYAIAITIGVGLMLGGVLSNFAQYRQYGFVPDFQYMTLFKRSVSAGDIIILLGLLSSIPSLFGGLNLVAQVNAQDFSTGFILMNVILALPLLFFGLKSLRSKKMNADDIAYLLPPDSDEVAEFIIRTFPEDPVGAISMIGDQLLNPERWGLIREAKRSNMPIPLIADLVHFNETGRISRHELAEDEIVFFEEFPEEFKQLVFEYCSKNKGINRKYFATLWALYFLYIRPEETSSNMQFLAQYYLGNAFCQRFRETENPEKYINNPQALFDRVLKIVPSSGVPYATVGEYAVGRGDETVLELDKKAIQADFDIGALRVVEGEGNVLTEEGRVIKPYLSVYVTDRALIKFLNDSYWNRIRSQVRTMLLRELKQRSLSTQLETILNREYEDLFDLRDALYDALERQSVRDRVDAYFRERDHRADYPMRLEEDGSVLLSTVIFDREYTGNGSHTIVIELLQRWLQTEKWTKNAKKELKRRFGNIEIMTERILMYYARKMGSERIIVPAGCYMFYNTEYDLHYNSVNRINTMYRTLGYTLVYENDKWYWQRPVPELSIDQLIVDKVNKNAAGRIPVLTYWLDQKGISLTKQPLIEQVGYLIVNILLRLIVPDMYASLITGALFFMLHYVRADYMPNAPPWQRILLITAANVISLNIPSQLFPSTPYIKLLSLCLYVCASSFHYYYEEMFLIKEKSVLTHRRSSFEAILSSNDGTMNALGDISDEKKIAQSVFSRIIPGWKHRWLAISRLPQGRGWPSLTEHVVQMLNNLDDIDLFNSIKDPVRVRRILLMQDLGKIATHHGPVSVTIARKLLTYLGYTEKEMEHDLNIIHHHASISYLSKTGEMDTGENVFDFINSLTVDDAEVLFVVQMADILEGKGAHSEPESVRRVREIAELILAIVKEKNVSEKEPQKIVLQAILNNIQQQQTRRKKQARRDSLCEVTPETIDDSHEQIRINNIVPVRAYEIHGQSTDDIVCDYYTNYDPLKDTPSCEKTVYVFIPTVRGDTAVRETMESVAYDMSLLEQLNPGYQCEFIICDNSSDGIVGPLSKTIEGYGRKGRRITLIRAPNWVGKNNAINLMHQIALRRDEAYKSVNPNFIGSYIHMSDDDSVFEEKPTASSNIYSNIRQIEDYNLRATSCTIIAPPVKFSLSRILEYLKFNILRIRVAENYRMPLPVLMGPGITLRTNDFPPEGIPENLGYEDCYLSMFYWPDAQMNPYSHLIHHGEAASFSQFLTRYWRDLTHSKLLSEYVSNKPELYVKRQGFLADREDIARKVTFVINQRHILSGRIFNWLNWKMKMFVMRSWAFIELWHPKTKHNSRSMWKIADFMGTGRAFQARKDFRKANRMYLKAYELSSIRNSRRIYLDMADGVITEDESKSFVNILEQKGVVLPHDIALILQQILPQLGPRAPPAMMLIGEALDYIIQNDFEMARTSFHHFDILCEHGCNDYQKLLRVASGDNIENWRVVNLVNTILQRYVSTDSTMDDLNTLLEIASKKGIVLGYKTGKEIFKRALSFKGTLTIDSMNVRITKQLSDVKYLAWCEESQQTVCLTFTHPLEHEINSEINHPLFVPVIGYDVNINCQITQGVEGQTLLSFLEERHSVEEILEIAAQVGGIVKDLHATGKIYGDVGGFNAMITESGLVFLTSVGVYEYNSLLDPQTDIFGFGSLLYYAFTGIKPVEVYGDEPYRRIKTIPPELDKLIQKLLGQSDNGTIYETMEEVLFEMKKIYADMIDKRELLSESCVQRLNEICHGAMLVSKEESMVVSKKISTISVESMYLLALEASNLDNWILAKESKQLLIECIRNIDQKAFLIELIDALRKNRITVDETISIELLRKAEELTADITVGSERYSNIKHITRGVFKGTNRYGEHVIVKIFTPWELKIAWRLEGEYFSNLIATDDVLNICVMEWIDQEFDDVIGKHSNIDKVLRAVIRLGDALTYAYEQGVVYRDIAPHNLMFKNQRVESACLIDFERSELLTSMNDGINIYEYAALMDSIFRGIPRYRLFAYHTSRSPRLTEGSFIEIPGIPLELNRIIRKGLGKDPSGETYASIDAMVKDISQLYRSEMHGTFLDDYLSGLNKDLDSLDQTYKTLMNICSDGDITLEMVDNLIRTRTIGGEYKVIVSNGNILDGVNPIHTSDIIDRYAEEIRNVFLKSQQYGVQFIDKKEIVETLSEIAVNLHATRESIPIKETGYFKRIWSYIDDVRVELQVRELVSRFKSEWDQVEDSKESRSGNVVYLVKPSVALPWQEDWAEHVVFSPLDVIAVFVKGGITPAQYEERLRELNVLKPTEQLKYPVLELNQLPQFVASKLEQLRECQAEMQQQNISKIIKQTGISSIKKAKAILALKKRLAEILAYDIGAEPIVIPNIVNETIDYFMNMITYPATQMQSKSKTEELVKIAERNFDEFTDRLFNRGLTSYERDRYLDQIRAIFSVDIDEFRMLVDSGILSILVPEWEDVIEIRQTRRHEYPLEKHIESVYRLASVADENDNEKMRKMRRLVALFHDIEKDDYYSGKNWELQSDWMHHIKSAETSSVAMARLGFNWRIRSHVYTQVLAHTFTGNLIYSDKDLFDRKDQKLRLVAALGSHERLLNAKKILLADLMSIQAEGDKILTTILQEPSEYAGMTLLEAVNALFEELNMLLLTRPYLGCMPCVQMARETFMYKIPHPEVIQTLVYLRRNMFADTPLPSESEIVKLAPDGNLLAPKHMPVQYPVWLEYIKNNRKGEDLAEYFLASAERRAQELGIDTQISDEYIPLATGVMTSKMEQTSGMVVRYPLHSLQTIDEFYHVFSERAVIGGGGLDKIISIIPHMAIQSVYAALPFMAVNGNRNAETLGDENALVQGIKSLDLVHKILHIQGELRAEEGAKDGAWGLPIGHRFGSLDDRLAFTWIIDPMDISSGFATRDGKGTITVWGCADVNNRDIEQTGFIRLPDEGIYVAEILSSKPALIGVNKSEKENLLAIAEAHGYQKNTEGIRNLNGSMLIRPRHYKMLRNMILAGIDVGEFTTTSGYTLMDLAKDGEAVEFCTAFNEFWENLVKDVEEKKVVKKGRMVFINDGTVEEAIGVAVGTLEFVIDSIASTEAIAAATILQSFGKGGILRGKTMLAMGIISQSASVDYKDEELLLTDLKGLRGREPLSHEKDILAKYGLHGNEEFVGSRSLTRSEHVVCVCAHIKPSRKELTNLNIPGVSIDENGIGSIYFLVASPGMGQVYYRAQHKTIVTLLKEELEILKREMTDVGAIITTYGNLALAWGDLGQYQKALNEIDAGIELLPDDNRLRSIRDYILGMKALVEDEENATEHALEYLNTAILNYQNEDDFYHEIKLRFTSVCFALAEEAVQEANVSRSNGDHEEERDSLRKALHYYQLSSKNGFIVYRVYSLPDTMREISERIEFLDSELQERNDIAEDVVIAKIDDLVISRQKWVDVEDSLVKIMIKALGEVKENCYGIYLEFQGKGGHLLITESTERDNVKDNNVCIPVDLLKRAEEGSREAYNELKNLVLLHGIWFESTSAADVSDKAAQLWEERLMKKNPRLKRIHTVLMRSRKKTMRRSVKRVLPILLQEIYWQWRMNIILFEENNSAFLQKIDKYKLGNKREFDVIDFLLSRGHHNPEIPSKIALVVAMYELSQMNFVKENDLNASIIDELISLIRADFDLLWSVFAEPFAVLEHFKGSVRFGELLMTHLYEMLDDALYKGERGRTKEILLEAHSIITDAKPKLAIFVEPSLRKSAEYKKYLERIILSEKRRGVQVTINNVTPDEADIILTYSDAIDLDTYETKKVFCFSRPGNLFFSEVILFDMIFGWIISQFVADMRIDLRELSDRSGWIRPHGHFAYGLNNEIIDYVGTEMINMLKSRMIHQAA